MMIRQIKVTEYVYIAKLNWPREYLEKLLVESVWLIKLIDKDCRDKNVNNARHTILDADMTCRLRWRWGHKANWCASHLGDWQTYKVLLLVGLEETEDNQGDRHCDTLHHSSGASNWSHRHSLVLLSAFVFFILNDELSSLGLSW